MAALVHVLAAAILCLAFFCWKASGQLPPDNFSLEIFGANQVTQARGSAASFTCQLGIGVSYRLKYNLQWVHVSRVPALQSVERILTENENVTDGGKHSVNIQVKGLQDPTPVVLTVKNVTDTDDGRYLCRVVHLQNTGTVKETEVSFSVQHEVERVELQINQGKAITPADSPVQTTLREGSYNVSCSALGFNPSSDYNVSVYLENDEIVGQDSRVPGLILMEEKANAAGAPRYSLEKTIQHVNLTEENSGKKLRCVARNVRLNTQREASATIMITHTDTDDDDDGDSGSTGTEDRSSSGPVQPDTNGNGAIGDHKQAGLPVLLATLALLLCTLL